ncbi:putative sh3 domain [Diplodia seriata]|uniref:Putative sh3 domain n=1 Tax=Diplodia seriata TaxID=420778 RepID=A0A0G2EQN1_9PEZI|nr:putative sh3 domain [Diplodia seriata]
MTRPTIIRADTIDLQDPGSPSAADHSRQPTQPAPLGAGPASPHQAAAIRHVEEDRANEEDGLVQQWNSPSGDNHDDHSGTDSADVTDDGDMADSETEDMDDDMLDKISSSPSIDDGSYYEDTDFYADELSEHVGPLRSEQYELESCGSDFGGDREGEMLVFPAGRPLPPIPVSDSANDLRELLAPRQSKSSLEREYSMEAMAWETDSNASSYDPRENDDNDDDDDDDDLKDTFLSLDEDRHDSAYGGECLRETEDIDFEFVYALHTFVATVEGQANATKGDTMLSAAMLGDSAEKSKNPLKKAMRRRNAKTVQFTAPTYVEASDYDFSSDEEDDDGEDFDSGPVHIEDTQEHEGDDGRETMTVEPLRIGGKKGDEGAERNSDESKNGDDKARTSDEMFDRARSYHIPQSLEVLANGHAAEQKISRNGTVRNTDSFFKDESVETRKITLTPNLLRDDSSGSTVRSEQRERGGSLDSLEKELKSPDKPKDDKKKKEKKPGMLRGLFGRKDKKAKSAENEQNDEKQSEELTRESLSRDSEETASPKEKEKESAKAENESSQQQQQPVRQTAKASKPSEKKTNGPQKSQPSDPTVQPAKSILQKSASQGAAEATMRLVSAGSERNQQEEQEDSEAAARAQGQAQAQAELQARAREEALYQAREAEKEAAAAAGRNRSGSSAKQAISNILHSKSSEREREREQKQESKAQKQEVKMPPREKVKKSKERAPLDDFDSTPEYEHADPFADVNEEERQPNGTQQQEQSLRPEDSNAPGDVSPIDMDQPPALVNDTSSQEEPDVSPVSPSGSPLRGELSVSSPAATRTTFTPSALNTNIPPASAHSPMTGEPPSAASLPAWSDASLRSYLDDGSDIRDMLVVVKDTSGVVPVGSDHPIMAGLFSDERSKVAAMGMQLDSLLGDWLSRKRRRNEGGRKQSC